MCGIAGIVNGDPRLIAEQMKHRGPDNTGVSGILGHTRLSILDLSGKGNQPLSTGRYSMVANCEIYNYLDLKTKLCRNDDLGIVELPAGNDAATLLLYIEKYGIDQALKDANGMYAIGLYDSVLETINLAVDRFCQKPLFFYHSGNVFAFASSPNALLHLQDRWEIDELGLQSYWKLGSVMGRSIWKGIHKLNAAEVLTYDINKNVYSVRRYWEPTFQSNTNGIEDLIIDSIQKVRVSDTPVYIFLSGGIDSTLVASQFGNGHAIHLDSPEYVYAKQAAERFNITLHKVSPKDYDAVESMKDYSEKCGSPSMAGLIPYITSKEAAKFCKVAISANGADELFGGYDRLSQNITDHQLKHIFRDIPGDIPQFEIDPRLSSGRWMELISYVQYDLNQTLDFGAMASSLEVRSPFLDHRLVEMALSIPLDTMPKKKLLKDMLRKMGFGNEFLDRKKHGFSLYVKPKGLPELQRQAVKWSLNNKFLNLGGKKWEQLGRRDQMYLEASAFGFKVWHDTFKNKIA